MKKGKSVSCTSQRTIIDILQCQSQVTQKRVEQNVKESESYGLMLDGYTDIQTRKHLALVVRYIDNGVSRLSFSQDIQLFNELLMLFTLR